MANKHVQFSRFPLVIPHQGWRRGKLVEDNEIRHGK